LITLLVLVVLAASGFVALGFYVDSLDTIFPNVWAEGFNVSGLTLQEAIYLLKNEGYENNADGISITVVFPDDTSFSVTGNEVGLSFNASEAAAAAFAFGREDSFFENEITFIRSLFDRTELNDLSTPDYDDNIIRSLAAEYTQQFNTTVFSGSLDRNDEYITVTRGTGLHSAREDVVISLALETLSQAISEHSELRVYYSPEEDIEDSVESQIRELRELFEYIHDDAVSAQWDVETLSATASSPGRTFDLERAIADLQSAASGGTVVIHIEELEPALTQEFFESLLYAHLLAGSTTRELSGNSNRLRNIQVAAGKIDGIILNPGDVFSFNETVGRRTVANGFRMANVIRNGVFEESIGGGICQVSSTLHDAVLHTHLEVVERYAHGLRIAYMPVAKEGFISDKSEDGETWVKQVGGRRFANDAMVSWGTNDYKFKNNTDFPLRIDAKVNGRDLVIELWGTNLDEDFNEDESYIVIETVILGTFQSGTVEMESESLPIGTRVVRQGASGQTGFRAETFKLHFSADGELLSRTSLGTNRYNAQNKIILIGTAPLVETPPVTSDPGTTDPGTTDPGTTDPGTTEPVGPGTTDPVEPGTTEPVEP